MYCAVMVVHLKLSQNAQTTRYVKARIEHNHMTSTDDCCFFSHDCTGRFYTNADMNEMMLAKYVAWNLLFRAIFFLGEPVFLVALLYFSALNQIEMLKRDSKE